MELEQLRHPPRSDDSDKHKVALSSSRRETNMHNMDATDEDSSSDEPQAVPLKKSRLKAIKGNIISAAANSIGDGNNLRALMTGKHEEENSMALDGPRDAAGGVSTSCLSAENSDNDETGEMMDESSDGKFSKQDELRKFFECDICNTTFSNGANMRRHRMRHTGVKPYGCKVCPKRFFRKDHLAEHMATHTKVLPFRCPICSKGFQRQIAMRAHFQNEHVGGPQEVVKTCPLCSVKAGSMKSLRHHFRTKHGIDLDDPSPSQRLLGLFNDSELSRSNGLQGQAGDYGELGQALGFDDQNKANGRAVEIPSHFMVPHIEITPKSFSFESSADSTQGFSARARQDDSGSNTPSTVSPHSDSSTVPSSSTVIKREVIDPSYEVGTYSTEALEVDVQDAPEDLSSTNSSNHYSTRCSSSSSSTLSPLKTLLDWKSGKSSNDNHSFLSHFDPQNQHHNAQTSEGDAITSSFGPETLNRKQLTLTDSHHQCQFCGIIFPDKTLYFLHKGCHSEGNPWRCNICRQLCSNVYDFNSHLLSKSHQ